VNRTLERHEADVASAWITPRPTVRARSDFACSTAPAAMRTRRVTPARSRRNARRSFAAIGSPASSRRCVCPTYGCSRRRRRRCAKRPTAGAPRVSTSPSRPAFCTVSRSTARCRCSAIVRSTSSPSTTSSSSYRRCLRMGESAKRFAPARVCFQDAARVVGRATGRAHRGARGRARTARGSRPGRAPVRRFGRRRAAHFDREGVQGARDSDVVAARPAPPAYLADAPAGALVGRNRRVRRAAQTLDHRRYVHARHGRRPRARARAAARVSTPAAYLRDTSAPRK
jgi:hypothetical protein